MKFFHFRGIVPHGPDLRIPDAGDDVAGLESCVVCRAVPGDTGDVKSRRDLLLLHLLAHGTAADPDEGRGLPVDHVLQDRLEFGDAENHRMLCILVAEHIRDPADQPSLSVQHPGSRGGIARGFRMEEGRRAVRHTDRGHSADHAVIRGMDHAERRPDRDQDIPAAEPVRVPEFQRCHAFCFLPVLIRHRDRKHRKPAGCIRPLDGCIRLQSLAEIHHQTVRAADCVSGGQDQDLTVRLCDHDA